MNHENLFTDEREKLEIKLRQNLSIKKKQMEEIMEVLEKWYREFLTDWDKCLKRSVIAAIQNGHKDKMNKQLGVFNFSNESIADEANEILKLGKKAVPPVDKGETSAVKTFEAELYQYLVKYRRQIERRPAIKLTEEDESISKWLETAIDDDEEKSSEHFEFYTGLYQNLEQAYRNVEREAYSTGMNMTATKLHNILNIKEHIWNEADKNLGFILLPCSKMVEAEKEMRTKLVAEMDGRSSDEIIEAVDQEAIKFESRLGSQQLGILESFMHTRRIIKPEVKIPFLKLNGKIQKLSQKEIAEKDCSKLTFRPVQDSVSWSLNNYSFILMLFLRELNQEIYLKYPELEGISVLNGNEFANSMEEIRNESKSYKALISADMDNAYTNISLTDLKYAVANLCKELGNEAWKTDLIIKLSELVLSNNFVEASIGIMKIGPCLPMGNCCSGEALDTVSIAYEMMTKVKKSKDKTEVPITIKMKISREENSRNKERPDSKKVHKRYRDDIYGMLVAEDTDNIVQDIFKIGQMYPKHIKLTIELGHFYQTFLDVAHYRELKQGEIATFVRRNFTVPPLFTPKLSSVPEGYKWSALKCELLRHRRICSDEKFIEVNDGCLVEEYHKLGYDRDEVLKIKRRSLAEYGRRYDEKYKLKTERKIPDTVLCGTKTVYEGFHNTHVILKELIKSGSVGVPKLPLMVPGTKLKSYLFTKRRYLAKQRRYLSNQPM